VIWTGDWKGTPVKQGSKGSKTGGKGGQQQYDYTSAIIIALCQGPANKIRNAWVDQTFLLYQTSSEPYTIPGGGGSYTPTQQPYFNFDQGVGAAKTYSVPVNDYGSPGPITLAGTQSVPMAFTASPTPGAGQYTINGSGAYVFSAACRNDGHDHLHVVSA